MKEKCQNYVIDICSQLKLDPLMNLIYRHNKINKIKKGNICGQLKIFVVSIKTEQKLS